LILRDVTVPRFNAPAEPARTVGFGKRDSARTVGFGERDSEKGRTDRFCMGEPARTDSLCIISTNARWSVCLRRWVSRLISLWSSNVFWKKTEYPPRTVWNPAVLRSFFTHPNWGLFLILLIFKYPELNF